MSLSEDALQAFISLCKENVEAAQAVVAEVAATRPRVKLGSAEAVFRHLEPFVKTADQELFFVLLLDGQHRLIRSIEVHRGTTTCSMVHPKQVYHEAVRTKGCAAVIVAHNHPSGSSAPSSEDINVTERLVKAGVLMGIPLLDHVILGDGEWKSLRQDGHCDE